ncbi:MAG: alpha-L-rhamnosidase C-terminal domain-containing protein [Thermomicrobiales bacterium]
MRQLSRVVLIVALLLPVWGTAAQGGESFLTADWQRYIVAPPGRQVAPRAVAGTAGEVHDPGAALAPGGGMAWLQSAGSGNTFLDLDFGQVVAGYLEIGFGGVSGPAPGVRVTFSESRIYLGDQSDFSRSDFTGGADYHVPAAGETWVDRNGCQFAGHVCADGLRGFRYVRIALAVKPGDEQYAASAGAVEIDYVRVNYTPYLGTPDTYRGWFLSSDDTLNRAWYASVYTTELNADRVTADSVDPRGGWSASLDGQVVLLDGAKRDRAPYIGDVLVAGTTFMLAHGDGGPVATVLADLAAHQREDGYVPPSTIENYSFCLFDYPSWWLLSLAEYSRQTGDLALATRLWPNLTRLLDGWYPRVTNARGLLEKSDALGSFGCGDYAFMPHDGEVAYYNALYLLALQDTAGLARDLGHAEAAAAWEGRADRLSIAFNQTFWDATAGAYRDVPGKAIYPQDANALALLTGAADPGRAAAVLARRERVAKPWGYGYVEGEDWYTGAEGRVYPFISYLEVLARFAQGDDYGALQQLRTTWGWMLARDPGPTVWEGIGNGGTVSSYLGAFTSMAHGWSSGAAPALTRGVLGVVPTGPGYASYDLAPHPGNLKWAQGRVPTPHGSIDVAWEHAGGRFTLQVDAPGGTVGRAQVPTFGLPSRITLDGRVAWEGSGEQSVEISSLAPGTHQIEVTAIERPGETACFAATGQCATGAFLAYWERYGGLAQFGYPLSGQFIETLEDGRRYAVQYFERARFEYHPENPAPYDILLGQFGRVFHPPDPPVLAQADHEFFAQTGHNVTPRFFAYWQANGGLPQFGLPLSEAFTERLEDGNRYLVQYFERARLEYHPESGDPRYQVQLGQFGRRVCGERCR